MALEGYFCMRSVIFIVFFLISTQVQAQWSAQSLEIISQAEVPFKDSFVSTSWGGCNINKPSLFETIQRKSFKIEEGFNNSKLKTYLYLHDDHHVKKRNLVIQLVGVFGNISDRGVKAISYQVANAGNNVLVFPNPLSKKFVKAMATGVQPGNLIEEGVFFHHMIYQAIEDIKKKYGLQVDKINILGVSYGAFLAAVINAIDSEQPIGYINDVTLFSPPLDIGVALENVDKGLDSIDYLYKKNPLATYVKSIFKVCRAKDENDINNDLEEISRVMTLHVVFHKELAKSLRQYNKNFNEQLIPEAGENRLGDVYQTWKRNVRFRIILKNLLTRTNQFIHSDMSRIEFHLQRNYLNRGRSNVKIFAAEDDFLNDGLFWQSDKKAADKQLIPFGGHLGYMGVYWFESLIKSVF